MRATLHTKSRCNRNNNVEDAKICLSACGPKVVSADDKECMLRCGQYYVTRDFAEAVFRQAILKRGQVRPLVHQLLYDMTSRGSTLTSLLPKLNGGSEWWQVILSAMSRSTVFRGLRRRFLDECYANEEFISIGIDGTFKLCFALKGQVPFNAPRRLRQKQPDRNAMHRIITVRGVTSAVLVAELAHTESVVEIRKVLVNTLTLEQRQQVRHVAVDCPSGSLFRGLKGVVPGLVWMSLDPLHIVFHYEEAQGRHRTPGSSWLRMAVQRFSNFDETMTEDSWGAAYSGQMITPTVNEGKLLDYIATGTMPVERAKMALESLQEHSNAPYYIRDEFLIVLAAISALFPEEMTRRRPGMSTTTRAMLHGSAEVGKVEWLLNGTRFSHSLPTSLRTLRPVGTTANEALHAELNSTFRRTHKLHRSSLESRLHFFVLGKLAAHNSALYRAGLTQMGSSVTLARVVGSLEMYSAATWRGWCRSDPCGEDSRRERTRERVRAREVDLAIEAERALLKRPAGATMKRPAGVVLERPARSEQQQPAPPKLSRDVAKRRTVFNLERPTRIWR